MIRIALGMLLLAGCTAPQPTQRARGPGTQRWVAVLVAGDNSLPVFDDATTAMAGLLTQSGVPEASIRRFSAAPDQLSKPRVQVATRSRVLDAVATMRPGPGQACLVFVTSHGARGEGIYLAPRTEFLLPGDLDTALRAGCGDAPSVAIVSGCYTGDFARAPVAQPNRIVLTAAAADRPSFGCGAGRDLTYYDQCLLGSLTSLPRDWQDVITETAKCVTQTETREHERASEPQSFVGAAAARLPVMGG